MFTDREATGNLIWAWLLVVALGLVDSVWARWSGFRFENFTTAGLLIAISLGFAVGCEYRGGNSRYRDLGHYLALWLAFPFVVNSLSYLVALAHRPLCDAQLSALDRLARFHWMRWFDLIQAHPFLRGFLGVVYSSMFLQTVCSVAIFALTKARQRNNELLWLALPAALQAVVISGFLPALGPMADGLPPWTATLLKLRQGALATVSLTSEVGIVAFPSIHTAFALIFVYVHRPPSAPFLPFALINAVMLLATPFVGHHYLTDMIGGAAVTAISIAIYRLAIRPATSTDSLAVRSRLAEIPMDGLRYLQRD